MSNILPDLSVVPSSGNYPAATSIADLNKSWHASGAIPASYSCGGQLYGSEGFVQQTFLGASIRSFSMNGGFGTSSASLNVELVNDEYNTSDGTPLGEGDDVYHSGLHDYFRPPTVGAPVFFKFGKFRADIEQAWRKVFDDAYHDPSGAHRWQREGTMGDDIGADSPGPSREILDFERMTHYPLPAQNSSVLSMNIKSPVDKANEKLQDGMYYVGPNPTSDGKYLIDAGSKNAKYETYDINNPEHGSGDLYISYEDMLNPDTIYRGRYHVPFGGILQGIDEKRGEGGNPVWSVSVTDPRNILASCSVILNGYAGTTYNNKNLFNVYGFLEHDPTDKLMDYLIGQYDSRSILNKKVGTGVAPPLGEVDSNGRVLDAGEVLYEGDDMYRKIGNYNYQGIDSCPLQFPVTGEGMARRTDKGIPWYRVRQGLEALLNTFGSLNHGPLSEYVEAGYGGYINFRGFNYAVDFGGIPLELIPDYYFVDFEEMTLLDLAMELCDAISHDLYVRLLPVIDHDACQWFYDRNEDLASAGREDEMVVGIIRLEAMDRSEKPRYGAIKDYISELSASGIGVTNSNTGTELTDVVTDKFVVGAQTSDLYFFDTTYDRDHLNARKSEIGALNTLPAQIANQWTLESSFNQQVIPFYGMLGPNTATIPRGFGSFQQIILDARDLNAFGVGNYYVATEMELRAASISYERWRDFLVLYNDMYMQSMEPGDAFDASMLSQTPHTDGFNPNISNNYGVACPRSVWRSDRNYMGPDGLPASPCSPPYGYPLYFKRAEKIGIPEAGIAGMSVQGNKIIQNLARLRNEVADPDSLNDNVTVLRDNINKINEEYNKKEEALSETEAPILYDNYPDEQRLQYHTDKETQEARIIQLKKEMEALSEQKDSLTRASISGSLSERRARATIGFVEETSRRVFGIMRSLTDYSDKAVENSQKVYQFVKGVADKHLGKDFLVKLPKETNLWYKNDITLKMPFGANPLTDDVARISEIEYGPFGFRPRPVNPDPDYYYKPDFQRELRLRRTTYDNSRTNSMGRYNGQAGAYTLGALKNNYNPIDDKWEYNYEPDTDGGFFDFEIFSNSFSKHDLERIPDENKLPKATLFNLFPFDTTNFMQDNGKISSYVRFDNSQFLSFEGVGADDMTQQLVTNRGEIIPDLVGALDNTAGAASEFESFNTKDKLLSLPKTVAFVKVEVDSKLYHAPRTVGIPTKKGRRDTKNLIGMPFFMDAVFGQDVIDIGQYYQPKSKHVVRTNQETGETTCTWVPMQGWYEANFIPNPANGGFAGGMAMQQDFYRVYDPVFDGQLIDTTFVSGVDPDHVYAKITLPGRIVPTIDSRMNDGPFQLFQGTMIKNFLTMDTVKGMPGFEIPTFRGKPRRFGPSCFGVTEGILNNVDIVANARNAFQTAMSALEYGSPERRIHLSSPSPVYPNVVALALRSNERCYGPWISSSLSGVSQRSIRKNRNFSTFRYGGIGGKVEFVKEEELAPWNYGGYQLMNEAGSLKAEFSNSILLQSEKGSLSFPNIPRGDQLFNTLGSGGPLITSVNIDVGINGLNTTFNMELYTPRFGKMQKQRKEALDKQSREKKKQRDFNNELRRRGLAKWQSRGGFSVDPSLANMAGVSESILSSFEKKPSKNLEVASVSYDDPLRMPDVVQGKGYEDLRPRRTEGLGTTTNETAFGNVQQSITNQDMGSFLAAQARVISPEMKQRLHQDNVVVDNAKARIAVSNAARAAGMAGKPYMDLTAKKINFYQKAYDNVGGGQPSDPSAVTKNTAVAGFQQPEGARGGAGDGSVYNPNEQSSIPLDTGVNNFVTGGTSTSAGIDNYRSSSAISVF